MARLDSRINKIRLEGFLDEDYPLDRFIDRVEHERLWVEATHTPSIGRVNPEKKTTQAKNEISRELKRQIKDLAE